MAKTLAVGSGGHKYLQPSDRKQRPAAVQPVRENERHDAVVGGAGPNTGGNTGGYASGRQ